MFTDDSMFSVVSVVVDSMGRYWMEYIQLQPHERNMNQNPCSISQNENEGDGTQGEHRQDDHPCCLESYLVLLLVLVPVLYLPCTCPSFPLQNKVQLKYIHIYMHTTAFAISSSSSLPL